MTPNSTKSKPKATAKPKREQASATTPGVIEPESLYTLEELKRRLGFKDWGLRKRRADGFIVYRVGGRGFVLGRDVIAFIQEHGVDNRATDPQSGGQDGGHNE